MPASQPYRKLSNLLTSTLSLLLERQRSYTLSLAPSSFTESTILRNFAVLNEGIEDLFLDGQDDEAEGEEEGWKKLDEGLERLVAMWEEHGGEESVSRVRGVREGMRSVTFSSYRFVLDKDATMIMADDASKEICHWNPKHNLTCTRFLSSSYPKLASHRVHSSPKSASILVQSNPFVPTDNIHDTSSDPSSPNGTDKLPQLLDVVALVILT